MPRLYLGLDQGSSGTKAVLLDDNGISQFEFSKAVTTRSSDDEKKEQEPEELLESVKDAIAEAKSQAVGNDIVALGLACQRSGVCAWEKSSGKPLSPLITWADTRFAPQVSRLEKQQDFVRSKTGLRMLANYAAPKIANLQALFPSKDVLIGTLDSFLLSRLSTGELFITEDGMAARTMLYDLEKGNWDIELCKLFSVDRARLANVNSSLYRHGMIDGIPLTAVLADQQAALFSAVSQGESALLNVGSIASLSVPTGHRVISTHGYLSGPFYSREEGKIKQTEYFLEAVTNACKAVIQYAYDELGVRSLEEAERLCTKDLGELFVTAYFPIGGTASPLWRADLPWVLSSSSGSKAARMRALFENIGNFIVFALENSKEASTILNTHKNLFVTGGGSKIGYLLQYMADISGITMKQAEDKEATARGAALAAMKSLLGNDAPKTHPVETKNFSPRVGEETRKRFETWVKLQTRVIAGDLSGLTIVREGK